jgi:hypothetical protein
MLAGNRPSGLRTSPAPVMLPPLYYRGDEQIFNRSPIIRVFSQLRLSYLHSFLHTLSVSLPRILLCPVYVSENRQEYLDEGEMEEQRKLRYG